LPRLLLILAVAAVVYILVARARSLPPGKRRGEYIKLALLGMLAVVIWLTLTGRMHWLGAALTGLLVVARQALPLLLRFFPALLSWHKRARAGTGQTSTVESAFLRMNLEHGSGTLSGEVLQGEHAGRQLDELDETQLQALYERFRQQDPDSARLLESYLQQRFGDTFTFGQSSESTSYTGGGSMSEAEALNILGLKKGASRDDVIAAHRRLMQKLHPDRGGNDYLAAKINAAKEYLLRGL